MSDSFKAAREAIDDCYDFLERHNIAWKDLTLEEKHAANIGNLDKLKQRLQDRGVQLCPGLQLAKPAVADEWASEYFQEPWPAEERQGISIPVEDWDAEFNTDWDGVLPDEAELFFDDGAFAFYRTEDGTVFVKESPSTESLGDPVEEEDRGDSLSLADVLKAAQRMWEEADPGCKDFAWMSGPIVRPMLAIADEREYQQKVWGGERVTESHDGPDNRSIDEWTLYILRYAGRLAAENGVDASVKWDKLAIVRKIAALCVACMEQHGAPLRKLEENINVRKF